MSDEHAALRSVMRIQGARSVTVVSLATEAVVWSETAAQPIGADVAGAISQLVGVAARMVRLNDGAEVLDDLVITSPAWFHVLRIAAAQGDTQVVHLLLDRRSANLALARWELRTLLDTATLPALPEPLPALPEPPGLPHRTSNKAAGAQPPPQRPADRRDAPASAPGETAVPAWLAQFAGETFEMDIQTLDRVLAGLRRLA
ncbi:hypothetical protein [Dactylosporangium sp. CA-233914]|uniref:hypothetical protein n=1 Tax=Dactylosporangium sp. CA-233914 TaxID=3239934 RepID=UPI003D8E295B